MPKALVIFSGGQDSTTCLYKAIADYGIANVHALTINYGQRHSIEIEAALTIASMVGLSSTAHEVLPVGRILQGTSPLTNKNAVLEQYESHAALPGGLEKTFVPARNFLFLTLAANRAYVLGCGSIIIGVSQEDYGGYPDCRSNFIEEVESAIQMGLEMDIEIETPLIELTKKATVELALTLPGCFFGLAFSHTAYDGGFPPIGHDHATLLRQKGFEEAGVPDPLTMRAHWEGLMPLPETPNYRRWANIIAAIEGDTTLHNTKDRLQAFGRAAETWYADPSQIPLVP